MAEGAAILFTNWRTGEQLPPSAAIGTASISAAQIQGPIGPLIGTASITNSQLAGPISSIIGTASISNAQLAGPISQTIGTASLVAAQISPPIVALIGTASLTNAQLQGAGATVLASGSLSGNSVAVIDIPSTFAYLGINFIAASHNSVSNRSIFVRVSTDNGATYDTNFIKTVTLAEYTAIVTKDATTLYFII